LRYTEDDVLLFIDRCHDLEAIQIEEGRHGRMPHSLVAIHKRMILDQRYAQCCGFVGQCRVQLLAVKRGLWLSQGGIEQAEIPNAI